MSEDTFSAGLDLGGLRNTHEIKIMVCVLLSESGKSLSFSQMNEAFQKHGLVNYFEFSKAVSELVDAGNIEIKDNAYVITSLGKQTALIFGNTLPVSVKEKALSTIRSILLRQAREVENITRIERVNDGYVLHITMLDIGTDLLDLSVFLPTVAECENIRKRFLNDPPFLYQGVLALLTGDLKTFGTLAPSEENIFD